MEYFERLQGDCGISPPLAIPLHSNVRWGTAHHMLDHISTLEKVNFFPICCRSISFLLQPFRLDKEDWKQVHDVRDILKLRIPLSFNIFLYDFDLNYIGLK